MLRPALSEWQSTKTRTWFGNYLFPHIVCKFYCCLIFLLQIFVLTGSVDHIVITLADLFACKHHFQILGLTDFFLSHIVFKYLYQLICLLIFYNIFVVKGSTMDVSRAAIVESLLWPVPPKMTLLLKRLILSLANILSCLRNCIFLYVFLDLTIS